MKKKKNGLGSGFGRKIERDGGIQRKKGGKAGFENPYCGPSQVLAILGDTGQSVCRVCKYNFLLYWCNRCSTGAD